MAKCSEHFRNCSVTASVAEPLTAGMLTDVHNIISVNQIQQMYVTQSDQSSRYSRSQQFTDGMLLNTNAQKIIKIKDSQLLSNRCSHII